MNVKSKLLKFRVIVLAGSIYTASFSLGAQNYYAAKSILLPGKLQGEICLPYSTNADQVQILQTHNENNSFAKKILKALALSIGYDATMGGVLLVLPEEISRWDRANKLKWTFMKERMKDAFTKPPVIDDDFWYINYIGHPYQGGYYFNNLRSQGAGFWESSAYLLGQSLLWEYIIEGWFERPSVQDLIVTPVAGALVGELSHKATVKMSRNGFSVYEKILVCLLNPSWAINNGFKTKKQMKFDL